MRLAPIRGGAKAPYWCILNLSPTSYGGYSGPGSGKLNRAFFPKFAILRATQSKLIYYLDTNGEVQIFLGMAC